LHQWPPPTIQRHAHIINEIMKKGLVDADAEARNVSRDCFPAFQKLFPGLAKSILDSLEPLQKRQLLSNITMQATTNYTRPTAPPSLPSNFPIQRTNGTPHQTPYQTSSLSRQGNNNSKYY
jgi:CLIP-associating protein 1/2